MPGLPTEVAVLSFRWTSSGHVGVSTVSTGGCHGPTCRILGGSIGRGRRRLTSLRVASSTLSTSSSTTSTTSTTTTLLSTTDVADVGGVTLPTSGDGGGIPERGDVCLANGESPLQIGYGALLQKLVLQLLVSDSDRD